MKSIFVFYIVIFFLIPSITWAWSPFAFEKGNKKYEEEKYEEAQGIYQGILEEEPDNLKTHYNLGDTFYRRGDYEKAEGHFYSSLNSSDSSLMEKSLYNLGNARFRQGSLKEAVDFYNKVLELNPDNKKAELNRDYVLKLLEEQKNKPSEQDKKSDQKPSEEDEEEKDSASSNDQKEKDKQDQQEGKEQEKDESQADASKDRPEKSDGGEKKPRPNISQREAEQWLESVEDDPKKAIQDMIWRDARNRGLEVEKDW